MRTQGGGKHGRKGTRRGKKGTRQKQHKKNSVRERSRSRGRSRTLPRPRARERGVKCDVLDAVNELAEGARAAPCGNVRPRVDRSADSEDDDDDADVNRDGDLISNMEILRQFTRRFSALAEQVQDRPGSREKAALFSACLLYTSDAADE